MKIFVIRDETDPTSKDIAFLIYYERDKRFYIELPENADPWETPLLLSSFLKRGEQTVNAYWSRTWVQQRIIPSDRQNLGQILKDNRLESYDEFDLLMLADGRCAQDDYYLVSVSEADLPENFVWRFQKKVEDVVPLTKKQLLVFFRDGNVKKCDVGSLLANDKAFSPIWKDENLFRSVSIQTGGYGVCWGENLNIADDVLYDRGKDVPLSLADFRRFVESRVVNTALNIADDVLYDRGKDVPLSLEDFRRFVESRVVNTAEAAELLGCSRQNIEDLIHRNKLHLIKTTPKNKLFLKSEILQRNWK
jgi:excisionase family DNA binding protein